MKEEILALFIRHRGKILGCVGGFVLGWLIISRGLIQTLILFICAGLVIILGKGWTMGRTGRDLGAFLAS